mmetsp:Transcript_32363/g.36837  ORF Transcript_32363/g.36837 Transcript_32363/m.36837 type:complete len:99 (+) Transcript_32363:514-810(+)
MIRQDYKIDILIDLNGWPKGNCMSIFVSRPAPVQIRHVLGFVGMTGCNDVFDYFVSDSVAWPERSMQRNKKYEVPELTMILHCYYNIVICCKCIDPPN